MRLTRLKVDGFRCLKDLDLEMRPLMVLIGPNGSGKTSLLDVFALLKGAVSDTLGNALIERGGLASVLTYNAPLDALNLSLNGVSTSGASQVAYLLELGFKPLIPSAGSDYEVLREALGMRSENSPEWRTLLFREKGAIRHYDSPTGGSKPPDRPVDSRELALSQLFHLFFEAWDLWQSLRNVVYISHLDMGRRAPVRLAQEIRPSRVPGANGEDLVATLQYLRSTRDPSYERILETLRAGFPCFRDLDFVPVAAGQVALAWFENPFARPFYASQLSEGTLRFLWLTTILLSPQPPALIMIDEPEISLHPELLKILPGLLQDAAVRTQLIVATQSPELIRWLEPSEIVVMDKGEDGFARARWADAMDIDFGAWLKEYTLGEMWTMGELGGRP
jgi:predicted ATPase